MPALRAVWSAVRRWYDALGDALGGVYRVGTLPPTLMGVAPPGVPAPAMPCDVHFSPRGGCTDTLVEELARARSSVLVQAYSFTSRPIADALVAAHGRGVSVRIVLDGAQRSAHGCQDGLCLAAGIELVYDQSHAIAHNKVMVIDAKVVVTGSFNFTASAEEHNAENMLVLRNPILAAVYAANWQKHRAHSVA